MGVLRASPWPYPINAEAKLSRSRADARTALAAWRRPHLRLGWLTPKLTTRRFTAVRCKLILKFQVPLGRVG